MKLCNGRCTNMNHEDGTKTLITVESFECERYAVLAGKIMLLPRSHSVFQASESQPQQMWKVVENLYLGAIIFLYKATNYALMEGKNMEKFEYKVVVYDTKGFWGGNVEENQLENQLNILGDDGWEMVSCTSTNQSSGSSKSIVCIFKRKKNS